VPKDTTPRTVIEVVYTWGGLGAVEQRAALEAETLLGAGYDVIVVSDISRHECPTGPAVYSGNRLALHRLLPGPAREVAAMLMVWRILARVLRAHQAEAVVFHSSTLSWPAVRLAGRGGSRSIFVVHGLLRASHLSTGRSPYGPVTTALYKVSNRHAARRSDRVVGVSRHIAELAVAEGASVQRVRVVPNPIDTSRFEIPAAVRDIDVIFAGRLVDQKGVDVLLEALTQMPMRVRTVVVGDGHRRAALEATARKGGLDVEFAGWVDRARLTNLLSRAAVQVVPSRWEPQGVVVLEGLAAGTPIIASDVGGIPEVVCSGENGWLVPAGDSLALRDALVRAISDRPALDAMRDPARSSITRFRLDGFLEPLEVGYLA
jgi:glycosyltransferase involved in cell wall biosynthesis